MPDSVPEEGIMLRVQRSSSGQVVFTLSGRIDEEHITDLKALLSSEANGRPIVLDLKDVTLAGPDAVSFLEQCEADGITLRRCAPYIREWITRQRRER
jgi:anti-anti-sigma regulatory factor